jgi:hypothetical protein
MRCTKTQIYLTLKVDLGPRISQVRWADNLRGNFVGGSFGGCHWRESASAEDRRDRRTLNTEIRSQRNPHNHQLP